MKKFYVSLLLFLLGTCCLFASETIDGINYELNNTDRTATVVYGGYSGAIVIPESVTYNNREYKVTTIAENAFRKWYSGSYGYGHYSTNPNLISVKLPSSITSIGKEAFAGCTSLNSVEISEGVSSLTIDASAFYGCKALNSIYLPSGVTRIEEQAFADCSSLAYVTLSDGLTYIGDYAFGALQKLSSITIPTTVTSMGMAVFYNCRHLSKIIWNAKHCSDFTGARTSPFSVSSYCNTFCDNIIYDDMAYYDTQYKTENTWTTSITFGDEVEHIPAYLCVNFEGELRNIIIPDNVKTIGDYAFNWCENLVSVKLGNGLTEIGKAAFNYCHSLNSITIPNNVESINQAAFGSCYSLNTITLGKNITTIGSQTFNDCYNISTINSYAVNPPAIESSVFSVSDLMAITLNVREKALEAYKAADVWKDMYVQALENDIRTFTLSVSSADESKGVTTMGGEYDEETEVLVYAAAKDGYQFSKWSDGNTDNPRTVKMVGNITLTAQFAAVIPVVKYTLTATANPLEGVAVGGGAYESGAQVTLAAVANAGYHFTQWADGNTSNPRQVTVAADGVYTAQFEKDAVIQRYTLTTSTTNAAQGTAYGQGTYEAGTQIAVFAVANDGYHFTQWHDGNTDNPRMVTVAADAIYFANFAQDPVAPTLYELSVSSESPAKGWTTEGCAYEMGAQVMIYAHPAAGFEFSQWSDGNTDNPRFITMTGEVNLTAQFVVKTTTNVSGANVSAAPAHKILRNGQVYIERNGKVYTVTGAEVK